MVKLMMKRDLLPKTFLVKSFAALQGTDLGLEIYPKKRFSQSCQGYTQSSRVKTTKTAWAYANINIRQSAKKF